MSTNGTVEIVTFKAKEGCQAHLVIDPATREAMAVDPRLDQVNEIAAAAEKAGAKIRFALDTHTHADHLSGVRRLADKTGAKILAAPASKIDLEAERLEDRSSFRVGETRVDVIHSPGHTPDSLSLRVGDHLFTGDALFVGGAGRTDFMGGSASALYDSFQRFKDLPATTIVHPGHDYVGRPETTIARELETNPLMLEKEREAFVRRMDVKGPPPPGMKDILAYNVKGPDATTLLPVELDALRRLNGDVTTIDVRSRSEYRASRLADSKHIPKEVLDERIGEIPEKGEIALVCLTGIRAEEARKVLGGHDRRARVLAGGLAAWKSAGLPVQGTGGLSVERQVQLIAGSFVAVGTLLGVLVSPWFLILPAFFGSGLVFTGATGTCGMGVVLSHAPWNRSEDVPEAACAVGGADPKASCAAGGGEPKAAAPKAATPNCAATPD